MNEKFNDYNDDDSIDLIALIMAILRHWKSIFAVTLLAAVGTFMFSRYLITPMYASESILYVLSKTTSITSLADIQMGASLTKDYQEVVLGRPVLDQVIADLLLDEDYKALHEKVKVDNPANTRLLYIRVTDADPERAKAIADDIAEVSAKFISEKMDQDPPSIIQYGYSDNEKVSPSLLKNTIIGAFAGGFLSSAIVAVFYFLNNTIDTPEDVESKLGLKLIAQIPLEHEENDKHEDKKRKKDKKRRRAEK